MFSFLSNSGFNLIMGLLIFLFCFSSGSALCAIPPTFTSFSGPVKFTDEDTVIEITLDEIKAKGDESVDTVSFVVKSISSGTLTIGPDLGAATDWAESSNDTIDAINNAYWTPEKNENGVLNAFEVVAKNSALESTPNVTALITVNPVNDAPLFNSDFGSGQVTVDFDSNYDEAYSMAIDSFGKTVVAGYSYINDVPDFSLVRYNKNGTLDTTFGISGKMTTDFGGDDYGGAVVIESSGKIVVVGYTYVNDQNNFALARYNTDGTLDTDFGEDGKVITDFNADAKAYSIDLDSDEKIVVAGSYNYNNSDYRYALARYNTDGTLDTTFGISGKVTTDFGGNDYGKAVVIESSGKIVVAGYTYVNNQNNFALARYNIDGTLDISFSDDGKVITDFNADAKAYTIALDTNENTIVGGTLNFDSDYVLCRYSSSGSLDTTFDNDGIVITDFDNHSNEKINSLFVQSDGKILAAGRYDNGSNLDFGLLRYNIDGSLDTTFGSNGVANKDIYGGFDEAFDLKINAEGMILLTGLAYNGPGGGPDFAVVTLNSDGVTATSDDTYFSLNNSVSYTEQGPAFVLDQDVAILDVELDALNSGQGNYAGSTLVLEQNVASDATDLFTLDDAGATYAISGNDLKTEGGQVFGIFTNTSGTLTINFTSIATIATTDLVNEVISSIHYASNKDNPQASQVLKWIFDDGNSDSQGSGGAILATGSTTVNITPVNDSPGLTLFANTVAAVDEDTQVEISFSDLTSQGNESDIDGTVDAFVVKSISSGNLKIGTTSSDATDWILSSNDTVDSSNNAYWTPVVDENGIFNAFKVIAKDNEGLESEDGNIQVQVDVNPINDPPTLASIADPTAISEDAPEQTVNLSSIGSGVLSGPGIENQTLVVTAVSDNTGLIPNPTVTYTSPETTGILAYTPVANANGTANITVTVTDSGLDGILGNGDDLTVYKSFTITVSPVNDAPVLDNSGEMFLTSVDEDLAENVNTGNTVSEIISSSRANSDNAITDFDSDSEGIAINAVDNTLGTWQYKIGDGTWTDITFPVETALVPVSVIGQPDLLSEDSGVGQNSLSGPESAAIDPTTGKLFIADTDNNRILRFSSIDSHAFGANAEAVLGQVDYTSSQANRGGAAATDTLFAPVGLSVDSSGSLYVADSLNHRILRYDNASSAVNGADADQVLGQADFMGSNPNRGAETSAGGLNKPQGLCIDNDGNLWVFDKVNSRVLRYDDVLNKADGEPADGVLGKPDFVSKDQQTTQEGMNQGTGVFCDTTGTLWVVDGNNRVLRFDNAALKEDGAPANGLLGQTEYTTNGVNSGISGFYDCKYVTVDTSGRLWVSETGYNRVLGFNNAASKANGALSDVVIQSTSPVNLVIDTLGNLWIPEKNTNRVLRFETGTCMLLSGSDMIRFLPTMPDWNGTVVSGVTFNAWDQTKGYVGDFVLTDPNGGITPFSENQEIMSITVNPVNDTPVLITNIDTNVVEKIYQFDGAEESGSFGQSVSSAGDVNNDGFADILIGDPYANSSMGSAFIYSGNPDDNNTLIKRFDGAEESGSFGQSVSSVGDVNNDGFDDILIGDPYANSYMGSAFIYSGNPDDNNTFIKRFDGAEESGYFGYSVSSAGDVNNDGFPDILIGAFGANSSMGSVFIYSGNPDDNNNPLIKKITGETSYNCFGKSVRSAGDVNNDGFDDVIIGAPQTNSYKGSAYVYSFNPVHEAQPLIKKFDGEAENGSFGCSVSSAGDVNNDGFDDIIIGAEQANSYKGSAYVYSFNPVHEAQSLIKRFDGEAENNYFGCSVSSAGDVNNDGYTDIIIGANSANSYKGSAYVYSFNPVHEAQPLINRFNGFENEEYFGCSVSSAGDVNNDGFDDVIIGASGANSFNGSAYIYSFKHKIVNLTAIDEDISDNTGMLVSDILNNSNLTITDADDATLGLAVTGVTDINGFWQYSTDNGFNWQNIIEANPITAPEVTLALLLAETAKIRFVPNANHNGSDNGSLTIKAWDKTSGALGDTNADTTVGTAWSVYEATFVIIVNPINDAPTLSAIADPPTIDEDAAEQTVSLTGIGSGVLSGSGIENDILVVTAVSDNTGLIPNPTVTYTSPALTGSLAYTPVADNHGSANITVTVTDSGQDGISGNADDLFVSDVFMVTVNAVNDTPTLVAISDPAAINEDAPEQTVSLAGIGSGVISGLGTETETLVVTAVSENIILIPNPTVTYTSPETTGSLAYIPVANANGTANITVTVTDSGLDGIFGNADDLFVSDVFMVTVNAVNDTPVLVAETTLNFDSIYENWDIQGNTSGNPTGLTVQNILNNSVTDIEQTSFGIAVIGVTGISIETGKWQYSELSNSENIEWIDFSSDIKMNNALLLNPESLIRYFPAQGYFGEPTFTYNAWDKSSELVEFTYTNASDAGVTGSVFSQGISTSTIKIYDYKVKLKILEDTVSETQGIIQGCTLEIPLPLDYDIEFLLTATGTGNYEQRITLPMFVTIAAGTTSENFDIAINDNSNIDGDCFFNISAVLEKWDSVSASLAITDDEVKTMSLLMPSEVNEGSTLNSASLILSGKVLEPLAITLASTADSIVLPETVIVAAQSDSVQFTFDVTDDTRLTGPRTSTISATVPLSGSLLGSLSGLTPEWTGITKNILIVDNEEKKMDIFAIASASEKAGVLENAGKISLRGSVDEDTIVSLSSSDMTRLTVPEQVIIPANTLEQAFSITIIDDQIQNLTDGVIITAVDAQTGYESTSVELFIQDDDYDRALLLTGPTSINENSGLNSGLLLLEISPVQTEGVIVDLTLSNENSVVLVDQIIVPANTATVKLDVTAVDNDHFNIIDNILITATAHSYSKSSLLLNLIDDEQKKVILNVPPSVLKTDGILSNAGSVTVPKGLTEDLVITLTSLNTSLVTLPSSVTVTAGQTTEYFDVTVKNDRDYLNMKRVGIQAYSTGWVSGSSAVNVFNPPKAEIAPSVIKAGQADQAVTLYLDPDCMTASTDINLDEGSSGDSNRGEIKSGLQYKAMKIVFVKDYFTLNPESGTGSGKLNLLVSDLYGKIVNLAETEVINKEENSVTITFAESVGYSESPLLRPVKIMLSGSTGANPLVDAEGNSVTAPVVTLLDYSRGDSAVREISVLSGDGDMNGSATSNSLNLSLKPEILPSLTTIISEVQPNSFILNNTADLAERTKTLNLFVSIPNIPENREPDKVDGKGVNQLSLMFAGAVAKVNSVVYYTGSPVNTTGITMESNIDYIKNIDPINSANKIIGFTKPLANSTVQTSEYLKIGCTLVSNGFEELIEVSGTMSYSNPKANSDTPVIKALITPGSADGTSANGDNMIISVDVITQSPELLGLSISDYYNTTEVVSSVKRKAQIKWSARDKDSSFVTALYWSVQDFTQSQVLEELKNSEPALYLVNDKEIFNAGLQTDMNNFEYLWDVSELHEMAELFDDNATESKALYLYAVSRDDNPITESQVLKSGTSFTVNKPATENLKPELIFSKDAGDGQITCDTQYEVKFVLKDDTADNMKVTLLYAHDHDSLRARGCVDNNSAYIIETITPDLNSADKFTEKSLIWNTTQVMGGSYFIMAKIEDGVHQDMEVWSDYRINVKHAATDNIAPAIKWTSPDLDSDSVEISENLVLNYELSDENRDTLSVQFGYATGNVVSEVRELKTVTDIDTSSGAVSGAVKFSISDISAGAYYIYTQIKETGKIEPPVVSWSRYPIEVNKSKNIYDLVIGAPEADPDNLGKSKCTVAFKTDCVALGSIEYGFSDISFTEITELNKGVSHNLVLTNLEPGKTYLLRAVASIVTTDGLKKEYLDNLGLYYEVQIPENILTSNQTCFVKGKINTQSAGIVKIYVVKPAATTEENELVSSPFIVVLDTLGHFTADIGNCIFDTALIEVPQNSWLARVEVILDNGHYLYVEDIALTGIENAVDPESAIELQGLWNSGAGAETPDTGLEKSKIALKKGFNMISLVLEPDEVLMASDILKTAGENAIMIAMYDAVTAGYKTYIRVDGDVFLGEDFSVKSEISFFIKVKEVAEYTFRGKKFKKSKMINLVKGFNLVSIPFSRKFPASYKTGMTAKSILNRIGNDGLAVYKYTNGAYVSYLRVGLNDKGKAIFMGTNFDIELGEGIFIYTKADTSFWAE